MSDEHSEVEHEGRIAMRWAEIVANGEPPPRPFRAFRMGYHCARLALQPPPESAEPAPVATESIAARVVVTSLPKRESRPAVVVGGSAEAEAATESGLAERVATREEFLSAPNLTAADKCRKGSAGWCFLRYGHDGPHLFNPGVTTESPAEATHEQARECMRVLWEGGIGERFDTMMRYIDQCEARQQQAESRVVNLEREHDSLQTQFKLVYRDRDELRAALQGKDEAIAELQSRLAGAVHALADAMEVLGHVEAQRDELSRKLEAAERDRDDYRIGARAEAERCDQLLAERNRARNETIAALERLETAERALNDFESPACSGEWLSGSGGHRKFGGCGRPAVWVEHGTGAAFCDEHGPQAPPAKPLTPDGDAAQVEREHPWRPEVEHPLDGPSARGAFALLSDANVDHAGKYRETALSKQNVIWLLLHAAWDLARRVDRLEAARLTRDDVKAIARAVVAEVAESAAGKYGGAVSGLVLAKLAEAAKEETHGR